MPIWGGSYGYMAGSIHKHASSPWGCGKNGGFAPQPAPQAVAAIWGGRECTGGVLGVYWEWTWGVLVGVHCGCAGVRVWGVAHEVAISQRIGIGAVLGRAPTPSATPHPLGVAAAVAVAAERRRAHVHSTTTTAPQARPVARPAAGGDFWRGLGERCMEEAPKATQEAARRVKRAHEGPLAGSRAHRRTRHGRTRHVQRQVRAQARAA